MVPVVVCAVLREKIIVIPRTPLENIVTPVVLGVLYGKTYQL